MSNLNDFMQKYEGGKLGKDDAVCRQCEGKITGLSCSKCSAPAASQSLGQNPKDITGRKKPQLHLIPPASLIYQALGMQDGAAKYGPYNWRDNKVVASIYISACMRHLGQWLDGEELANDSQKPHLAHAISCLGILIDALETGNLQDDRPTPGAASALMKKWETK